MDTKLDIAVTKRLSDQGHLNKPPTTIEEAFDYMNAHHDALIHAVNEELSHIMSMPTNNTKEAS